MRGAVSQGDPPRSSGSSSFLVEHSNANVDWCSTVVLNCHVMSFGALRAACADGRTSNVYYRQTELQRLYSTLVQHSPAIEDAIISDTGTSRAEARYELALALRALQTVSTGLDPKEELSLEYSLTRSQNALTARKGVGIVALRPTQHTLLFSIISPLCAAIAAGNCVVLCLPKTTSTTSSLLQQILVPALDRDAFMIADAPFRDDVLQEVTIDVIQDFRSEGHHLANQVVSTPAALTVAFVDRTADLMTAAKSIVHARLARGGKSPYAPDIVLVNEFVREKFLQAVIHALHSEQDAPSIQENQSPAAGKGRSEMKHAISESKKQTSSRLVSEAERGVVVEAKDRDHSLMLTKIHDPCLFVHTVRSLDDAIDFANSGKTLLACYFFARLDAAKYLSQFVEAHVSFVNQIPSELLVGPAHPLDYAVDPTLRYSPMTFSRPRPNYATSATLTNNAATIMSSDTASIDKLLATAKSGLPIRQRAKQNTTAFGFFEHALLLHLGLMAALGLGATAAAIWAIRRR
ncbi:ALDH-like protein [Teratosphaeria nubilosa]|uniref:ALDH-like protein n=1 Tax=Teratosphaeria nubilosa TaxID=161662 RepID=A0A6G1L7P5_9PEZI|nr:ALDH-like protein [Teratosphaeria nubilosa]